MQGLIILAAGSGKRMQASVSKQYLSLKGRPLLSYTIENLRLALPKARLILVYKEADKPYLEEVLEDTGLQPEDYTLVLGGKERQDSVYFGLKAMPKEVDEVFIHDGARPFVSQTLVENLLKGLEMAEGVIPLIKVTDTVKVIEDGFIQKTLPRESLGLAQTPQAFKRALILDLHERARQEGLLVTDDASLCEHYDIKVKAVLGEATNRKITIKEDLAWAEWRLSCELE